MPRRTNRCVLGQTAHTVSIRAGGRGRVDTGTPGLESLEGRTLMSFSWSASEVYLSELVNRARANPQAEATRLGLNLAAGLTSAEAARLVAQEPLALNQYLTAAARAHSLDMATRNFFDHVNPSGESPTDRAHNAGYGGTAGENIAGGYSTIDAVHRAWMESVGHRKNVLSLHSNFDSTFHYDEFGPGFALNAGGAYNNYYTEVFGYQGSSPARYILGVVFDDANNNNFYGVGEGAGGVRIDVALQSAPGTTVATYTTDAAGNYQLAVASGAYNITFTRLSDGYAVTKTATVSGYNVKVDAETGELVSSTPTDDFADQGEWSSAGVIPLDPSLGHGAQAGLFEVGGDSDLFTFVATKTGVTTITLSHPTGAFAVQIAAYNSATTLVGTGSAGGDFGNGSVVSFSVTAGQTYYLVATATSPADAGAYVITIQGPSGSQSDDAANIGDWDNAGSISLSPDTGDGVRYGVLGTAGDTDIFRFTATRDGESRIELGHPGGAFASQLRIFDANGTQLQVGQADGTDSVLTIELTAGQVYYVSAEAVDGVSLGIYLINVFGPEEDPGDGDPPPVVINEGVLPSMESLVTTLWLNGKLTLVFTNGWGQPLLASPNGDGSWTWYDIRGENGANPVVDGDIVAWKDVREQRLYAAIRGLDGLLLFREEAPGIWSHRNLTDEIDGSLYISADIELVFDPMNRAMLAGISDGGDLILYSQTLQKPDGENYKWTFRNITGRDVEPRGIEMPYAASELVSWVTGAKACNLAFVDENGDIQLFYKPKGKLRWSMQNLSDVAGTGPLAGELTVFQTPRNQGVHISATDENGHLWVTSYTRKGGWWGRNLTSRLNGYAFGARTIASYQNKSGISFVVGIKDDGNLSLYRYMATRNSWAKVDVNLTPPEFRNMAGRLSVVVDRETAEINIVGTLDSRRLARWTWNPGQGWRFEDVTYKLAEAA